MIYIQTCAYNAEKTIRETICSVLRQTYKDFEYHILDNGSTDKTRQIIQEYAVKDKRIVCYYSNTNKDYSDNLDFWTLSKHIPKGDYFCILDADDTYELQFFEEMLKFVKNNELDIAACGTKFWDAESGKLLGSQVLKHSVVVKNAITMERALPEIYWNMRQSWGKLYSSKAASARFGIEFPVWYPVYGGDTANVFECIKLVGNFGVYARGLHNYTMSTKSVSHKWISKREKSDEILYIKATEMLEKICGRVSFINQIFLYAVYFCALNDTLSVLLKSKQTFSEKIGLLDSIFSTTLTQQVMKTDLSSFAVTNVEKEAFFKQVFSWIAQWGSDYQQSDIPKIIKIYSLVNCEFEKLITPVYLAWYLKNVPQVVTATALKDYRKALELLKEYTQYKQLTSFALFFAQTLAALLEEEGEYIYFEKEIINAFIEEKKYEEAKNELMEWKQLLPFDIDLKKLEGEVYTLENKCIK